MGVPPRTGQLRIPATPLLLVTLLPEIVVFVIIAVAEGPVVAVRFRIAPKNPVELFPEMVLLLTVRNAGDPGFGPLGKTASLSIPPAVLLLTVLSFTVSVAPLL